jgi:hypothetical protein
VTALADDLDLVLGHRPISVSEPTVLESLRLAYRRNTRAVWLVAGVLLLLVTAALASRWRELSSEHGRITKEVSRIEERIERLEGPDAVRAAAIELLPLLEAAERFDRRLGAGLFDPVRESTARTVVGLEGRLVELFARAKQDSARRGATFQRSSFRSAVEVLAASLQPLGRPLPSELADEGRVFLPPEVEGRDLFVFEQVESQEDVHSYLRAYRFFHPIGSNFPAYPESGAYCLLAYDDGVLVWERELSHDASKIGSRELRYGLRDPDRFRAARVVPAGSVDVWMPEVPDHPQTGPVAEVALAAFAVLPAPVSQRELCRFLVATGKSTDGFDPSSDEPADVSEPLAREYCEHVGGRLPLRIELHAACTEAWFEPSLLPQDAPEPQITWEWIADKLSGPTELFAVSQQYLRRAFRNGPGIQDISPSARFREPTYFRVVFTIATPEELLLSGVLSPR